MLIYNELLFNKKINRIINEQCLGNKNLFCLRTGIKKITLYKILSRENINPSLETVLSIKRTFPDVNLNWLLADEKIMFKSDYNLLADHCKKLEIEIIKKDILIEYLKKI